MKTKKKTTETSSEKPRYVPLWDLDRATLERLADSTGGVNVRRTFMDDHLACVDVDIWPTGGKTVYTQLWWIGSEGLLRLGNPKKAFGLVREMAKSELLERGED